MMDIVSWSFGNEAYPQDKPVCVTSHGNRELNSSADPCSYISIPLNHHAPSLPLMFGRRSDSSSVASGTMGLRRTTPSAS